MTDIITTADKLACAEHELRAALDGVLSIDDGYLQRTLAKFEQLRFDAYDPTVRGASLWAYQRGGTGALWVHFTPGGRMLNVAAMFYNPDFSSTITYQLPRDLRPKKHAGGR